MTFGHVQNERDTLENETFRTQWAALVATPSWAVTQLRAGCFADELPSLYRLISFCLVWNKCFILHLMR